MTPSETLLDRICRRWPNTDLDITYRRGHGWAVSVYLARGWLTAYSPPCRTLAAAMRAVLKHPPFMGVLP